MSSQKETPISAEEWGRKNLEEILRFSRREAYEDEQEIVDSAQGYVESLQIRIIELRAALSEARTDDAKRKNARDRIKDAWSEIEDDWPHAADSTRWVKHAAILWKAIDDALGRGPSERGTET